MNRTSTPSWLPPALSLLLIGWGANQFASLLVFYQEAYGFSQLTVTSMLGIYVGGLIPALLVGGKVSDRLGRKRASIVALLTATIASVVTACGAWSAFFIFAGRLLAGVATGVAMAATSSWVKELSQAPWDQRSGDGAGARRASLFTAGGFWLGPVVSGLLASFAPAPETLPYLLHVALSIPFIVILAQLPETGPSTATSSRNSGVTESEAYPDASRRFWRIVGPGAPWVFAAGTIGFAVVPALMTSLGDQLLLYSTVAVAITLGSGVAIQPFARKLDRGDSARGSITSMSLIIIGLLLGILAGVEQIPAVGLAASGLLGAGYGLMLVSGMLETQRTTAADALGAGMGKFYTLAYAGFLAPTILAFFGMWLNDVALLWCVVALALLSLTSMLVSSRRYLPKHAGTSVGAR